MRSVSAVNTTAVIVRPPADRLARRLLRLPEDAPRSSIMGAQSAFNRSIAISATRCLITYVLLPVLAPLVDLTGAFGPVLGLLLGAVSMTAIFFSMRRFFAADHAWRWKYAALGGGVFILLIVQAGIDLATLFD